jgi:trans-L-3-hydroxyproline dehydratase
VGIDAPCGFIEAFVAWDGRDVGGVRFVNVPSFAWMLDASVDTPSFGTVTGDIAYGGAFYFYVDGAAHDLDIHDVRIEALKNFGMEVLDAANAKYAVVHPELADIAGVYGTIINSPPTQAGSTQSNACIFADRELDRSPTGSGTAGRIAQLHARTQFALGDVLVNESIIGSIFTGRILAETQLAGRAAIVPEIQGEAYICGFAKWLIDERDPLTHGFQLRNALQTSQ